MRTREVAEICGVTEECIRQNAKKVGIDVGDRWNPHEFTEDELKKIQVILMKNQTTRGNMSTETVTSINQVKLGESLTLQAVIESGDEAVFKDYMKEIADRFKTRQALMIEQQRNQQLLIENDQLTHALEYDKIKDWRPWNEVKAELKSEFEIFRHRISFDDVVNSVGLIKGEDYEEKVMGRDTRPTKMISPEGEDKIFDWYDTHTF